MRLLWQTLSHGFLLGSSVMKSFRVSYSVFLIPLLSACSAGSSAKPGDEATSVGPDGTDPTSIRITPADGERDPADTRDVRVRHVECDSNGENCGCLKLALLGSLESAADDTDTKPFVDWLNERSGGMATVTMVTSKPTLDAAFLLQYDILLVANVDGWAFSADERAAVADWSRQEGGGIITITGFLSTPTEPASSSQLVDFAGMGFSNRTTAPEGEGERIPILHADGQTDIRYCMTAWTGQDSGVAYITAPISFVPQQGSLEKLTQGLTRVGAYVGWEALAPAGSVVVATDPTTNLAMGVALEYEQAGRIFAFGDEWVIFANQWEPSGEATSAPDQYNKCYVMPTADEDGYFESVATLYQTKQFWYNAISWVAPPNTCNLKIDDERIQVF